MSFGMFPVVGKRGKRRSCRWKEPAADEWDANLAQRGK
jgi:hypothetical protein